MIVKKIVSVPASSVRKSGEKKIVVIDGDFNGHVGNNVEDYQDQHAAYGYGFWKMKGEKIVELCGHMNMILGNTLFKKRTSHLITYESGPSKTQVDYC